MPSLTTWPKPADIQSPRATAPQGAGQVADAVRDASERTGVSFAYLMEKASVESGFKTDAKAATSSATGLYQFIDSTWLNTIAQHGAEHGLGHYAAAIKHRDGRAFVADPDMRREILDLRKDPKISAQMAAEFTRDNQEYLEQTVGGAIGSTELYLAHFLGAGGAAKFLQGLRKDAEQPAANIFPEAAGANRAVFYDRDSGQALSLRQIYNRFAKRFDDEVKVASLTGGDSAKSTGGATASAGNPLRVLSGQPLDMFTVLTLNALETPLDDERDKRQDNQRRVRDEMSPVKPDTPTSAALRGAQA
ncbi:MAG TPA: hypothetical protein VEB64_05855 [Azospirillaceae bacterium]|nr:hypothetical protein [Azospirillaceae bacterium]